MSRTCIGTVVKVIFLSNCLTQDKPVNIAALLIQPSVLIPIQMEGNVPENLIHNPHQCITRSFEMSVILQLNWSQ